MLKSNYIMTIKKCACTLAVVLIFILLSACGEKNATIPEISDGDAGIAEGLPVSTTENKLGDVAQGKKYTLTVDSVDATPEYGNYMTTEANEQQ